MLFEISDSVIDEIHSQGLSKYYNAINILINEHFEGYHYLFISRKNINFLIEKYIEYKDIINVSRLKNLKSNIATYGVIRDSVNVKVILIDNNESYKREMTPTNQLLIFFPLSEVTDRFDKVILIGENSNDAELFEFLAKQAIKEKLIPYLGEIKTHKITGGGSQSYNVFKSQIAQKYMTFCITDSDKKTSQGNVGETARKVDEIKKKGEIGIYDHFILPIAEKENLFPPSVYKKIVTDPNEKKMLGKLELFEQDPHKNECLLYFDIKSGYKKKHYESLEIKSYFKEIFSVCEELLIKEVKNDMTDESNEKLIFKGLGDKISDKVKREIEQEELGVFQTKNFLTEHIPDYCLEKIIILTSRITSWACCPKKDYLR